MVPLPIKGNGFFMIIISPFHTRSSYTKEAVDIFIEQADYKVMLLLYQLYV